MAYVFDPADLDELVDAIKATDPEHDQLRSVALDPADVKLPGVWVRLDRLRPATLDGLDVGVTVFLIVPAAGGYARQLAGLAELFNLVHPALPGAGAGDATSASVVLPSSPTAMPALAVPVSLLTHPTVEP